MKRLFGALGAALAVTAMLLTPLDAMAQRGGGGGHMGGGGMGGGGGWHGGGMGGGGWHGGGWHGGGGWRGGGFHGGHFHGGGCWGCFSPFFFGLGFASAWPWWGSPWWGWGSPWWWGPGPGWTGYDSDGDGYPDSYSGGYPGGYYAPPAATAPAACGRWVWRTDTSHYQWVPQACAPAAPQAAPAPGY